MKKQITTNYEDILHFYKITPTLIRLEILKAIYSCSVEFTLQHIVEIVEQSIPGIGSKSVMTILRLYRNRGLLIKLENKIHQAGRPVSWFRISGKHLQSIL